MLSPELVKLKSSLEGKNVTVDSDKLLEELKILEQGNISALLESLAVSSEYCPSCGKKL